MKAGDIAERAALIRDGLLDLLYPPCCLVCGARPAEPLCAACIVEIQPFQPPFCDRCGAPVPAGHPVCPACAVSNPPFAWSQAMGQYAGPLQKAIHRLKYEGRTALARPLGVLLARSLDRPPSPLLSSGLPGETPGFDCVVPVPLHPARFRERGYNQAERLARVVAQERGWQLETRGLLRIRRTRTQTDLGPEERAANVRGAFAAREPLAFDNQRVLLIDDVLTTGSTMRECARVVQEAGAVRVCLVALARGT
jgi:ComF family protein